MMDSGKWTITLLLLTTVALTASQLDDDVLLTDFNVFSGFEWDLECENSSDITRPFWRKGHDILVFLDEVVIKNPLNRSASLRTMNVTFDGKSFYKCIVHTQPINTSTQRQVKAETPCEEPRKPFKGDYESETDTYRTGDTIRYHCHRGHRLIGQSNRTCTGTSKGWQPEEPYCEPEYIGRLLIRLYGIEDKVSEIAQGITTVENNTEEVGEKITAIYNILLTNDHKSASIESRLSSVVDDISSLQSFHRPTDKVKKPLVVCSNDTEAIDKVTVFKCMRQLGVRNGHNVSEYEWVIKDYNSKASIKPGLYYSPPFYQAVPGHKLMLRGNIFRDTDIRIALFLLPGAFDDQLTWPFGNEHNLTVVMTNGTEVLHRSFSMEDQPCQLNRTTSATHFVCYDLNPNWWDVWPTKQHISNDGSVIIKLHLYN